MNAKIRMHNIPAEKKDVWEREHEAWIRARAEEMEKMFRECLTARAIAALALAASDQLHFGPQRAKRLIDGAMEILMGEAFESIGRGEEMKDGIDPTLDAMLCEAASRGLYICFGDTPGYKDPDEIGARLGTRYERGRNARRPMVWGIKKEGPPDAGTSDGQGGEK